MTILAIELKIEVILLTSGLELFFFAAQQEATFMMIADLPVVFHE